MVAQRIEEKSMKPGSHQTEIRITILENSLGNINESLLRMEKRFDKMDERFDKIDQRFEKIDSKFEKIESRINQLQNDTHSNFIRVYEKIDGSAKWLIGLGVSVFFSAATLGFSIYHFYHG
jgi:chromosome segregation ATPase